MSRSINNTYRLWTHSHRTPSVGDVMAAPISDATKLFGERVRARRTELGWTQEALAEAAQLHWTYVGQVERGERNISLRNITRLAGALELDAGELVSTLYAW